MLVVELDANTCVSDAQGSICISRDVACVFRRAQTSPEGLASVHKGPAYPQALALKSPAQIGWGIIQRMSSKCYSYLLSYCNRPSYSGLLGISKWDP
jgi:hypothetical protein